MKKIIFVHLLNDRSGSPKVLSQVIKAAEKNRCNVELYSGKSEDGFLSELVEDHHKYFFQRFDNKYLTLFFYIVSQLSLFIKLLKYRNNDVVIYVNTMMPFGAALVGKLMGKPVYYHIQETSITPLIFKKFLRFIIQKSASKIIFVSNELKKQESFINIEQHVIYNAIPSNFAITAIQSKYQYIRDKQFNVLMVCSLKAYKGVDEFVDIAILCQKTSQIQFTLVLNANQSEMDNYFKKGILPLNLTMVSRQKNLVPFYEKASLLLNLSRVDEAVETFGLTIIEAIAFGIPVIVPPVGGPAEIVRDGVEGYLISSYETEKIAEKIIALSNDEQQCLELSLAARKRVEDFREDVFEKNIIEIISN